MPRTKLVVAPGQPKPVQAIQARLRRVLWEALKEAAESNGRSLNSEIQARLEASFAFDDALGGPRLKLLTRLWNAAFQHGGHLAARAAGHQEWTSDQWLDDPHAYRTAVVAADDVLTANAPGRSEIKRAAPRP